MSARSILFTPANYTKCEDGTKTQTRRIVKNPYWYACLTGDCPHDHRDVCQREMATHCPYGTVGDRLYVKEGLERDGQYIRYRRGLPIRVISPERIYALWHWKKNYLSPLHMPKWAARLWLEITEVRVERLQEIMNEDARAEGPSFASPHRHGAEGLLFEQSAGTIIKDPYADRHDTGFQDCWICPFRQLWQSIHGAGSWDQNPWVWAITFKKVT